MACSSLDIVVLGLSITSAWGNGHATTWRALLKALRARGHRIRFLERDVPWYARHRDAADPNWGEIVLYSSLEELHDAHAQAVREADAVILGSYVPDGIVVGDWLLETASGVRAFYDIDTPVTLAGLERGEVPYLQAAQIPCFDLYLSFTSGPTLDRLQQRWGARSAHALYCAVDPDLYFPQDLAEEWALAYMGTWSADRQPALDRLLIEPARHRPALRFAVAGPQYPQAIVWPPNVQRIEHLPPQEHRAFYNRCGFTLNLTRADMKRAGYAPSVRLFEAAACAAPVVSDRWPGLDTLFEPDREILLADDATQVLRILDRTSACERRAIGRRARERVLGQHTAAHRAESLERLLHQTRRRNDIARLGPWFHNLHLPDGVQTAAEHFIGGDFPTFKWRQIEASIPARLDGWRVLDVGCNAGFYSLELARRGATVLAIDVDERYLAQGRWAAREFGLDRRIEFRCAEIYELLGDPQRFDLVWFMGVFYHLRYPLLALDLLARRARRLLVFQTLTMPGPEPADQGSPNADASTRSRGDERHSPAPTLEDRSALMAATWPKMAFFRDGFVGDPTNWWAPNPAGVEALLHTAGLDVIARPGHEIYVCRPASDAEARAANYRSQFDALERAALHPHSHSAETAHDRGD